MKEIQVNKCVIGETYYLHGGWYDYDFETFKHKPLINTPVVFQGKSNSESNINKHWMDRTGKFVFELPDGAVVKPYAKDTMLLEPIIDPPILRGKP